MSSKLQLKNVTLAALTSVNVYETVKAMQYSMRGIDFGDAVLITDQKPFYLPSSIRFSQTTRLNTIDDYSMKCIYELKDHIRTDFVLIVHYDGYVVHPEKWSEEFLQYDYIGAPWPEKEHFLDPEGKMCRVGNGVSLRSRRILELPSELGLSLEATKDTSGHVLNEDNFLCVLHHKILEENGIRFAPLELAAAFGREKTIPENEDLDPFLFHKWTDQNKYPQFYSPISFVRKVRKWLSKHQAGQRGH